MTAAGGTGPLDMPPTAPDDWAVVIGDVVGKGAVAATLTSHAKAGAGFGAAKVGGYPVRSRGPFHVAVRATAREDVGPVVLDVASHGRGPGRRRAGALVVMTAVVGCSSQPSTDDADAAGEDTRRRRVAAAVGGLGCRTATARARPLTFGG